MGPPAPARAARPARPTQALRTRQCKQQRQQGASCTPTSTPAANPMHPGVAAPRYVNGLELCCSGQAFQGGPTLRGGLAKRASLGMACSRHSANSCMQKCWGAFWAALLSDPLAPVPALRLLPGPHPRLAPSPSATGRRRRSAGGRPAAAAKARGPTGRGLARVLPEWWVGGCAWVGGWSHRGAGPA